MTLKLITAPATEPITATEAKLHCRIDSSDEDALVTMLIVAARQAAEQRTGRALITQTWELALDAFPDGDIDLVKTPVQSISSIKYYDVDGIEQTVSATDYTLDNYGDKRHWVIPAYDTEWPDTLDSANAVKVRFVAGYGDATAVSADIKIWMLLAIGTMYAQRESIAVTQGAMMALPGEFWQSMLDPYIVMAF